MLKFMKLATIASCALVCSCGGDGGSGGSVVNTPGGPSSPPPTPTPSPTSSSVYFQLDLSKSTSMAAISSHMNVVTKYTSDVSPYYYFESGESSVEDENKAAVNYSPMEGVFSIAHGTRELFARDDLVPGYADNGAKFLIYYRKANPRSDLKDYSGAAEARYFSDYNAKYISIAEFEERGGYPGAPARRIYTLANYLVGTPTSDGDFPRNSQARYTTDFNGTMSDKSTVFSIGWMQKNLDVDFTARTIRGEIITRQTSYLTGDKPVETLLTINASYESSNRRITGTLESADGAFVGRVLGYFYGPGADEVGLVVRMTRQNGMEPISGYITGIRNRTPL